MHAIRTKKDNDLLLLCAFELPCTKQVVRYWSHSLSYIGTGTNACYLEKLSDVGTWTGDDREPRKVIINMEWGAFGDDGALDKYRTEFDKEMDKLSINATKQL